MSDDPMEYDCGDCGAHVLAWGYSIRPSRCATCHWIVENVPAAEQPAMRARLGHRLKADRDDAAADDPAGPAVPVIRPLWQGDQE